MVESLNCYTSGPVSESYHLQNIFNIYKREFPFFFVNQGVQANRQPWQFKRSSLVQGSSTALAVQLVESTPKSHWVTVQPPGRTGF